MRPAPVFEGALAARLVPCLDVLDAPPRVLTLGWPELEAALPDGGLPRGVVELASPRAMGGPTTIAAAAVRAAHAADPRAWCAWIDPASTLYGPGLAAAGVDLARLLVARPAAKDVARVAVKIAQARAFDVLVVDADALDGEGEGRGRRGWRGDVIVRKLALLAEEGGVTVVLLTDVGARRQLPWPVALRLELARPGPDALVVRVAKDRRGRIGLARTLPMVSSRRRAPVATRSAG